MVEAWLDDLEADIAAQIAAEGSSPIVLMRGRRLSQGVGPAEAIQSVGAAEAAVTPVGVDGPAGVARRLILLLHYGIDWSGGWVAGYRKTYWDQVLPDRLIVATYRADTLRRWWSEVAAELESQPRNSAEREEVEALLRAEAAPVMETIRTETEALLLRTRITTDAVRAARA